MGYATQAVMEAKKVALEVLEFALDLKAEEQCSKVRGGGGAAVRQPACGEGCACLAGGSGMLSTTYALGSMHRTVHGRCQISTMAADRRAAFTFPMPCQGQPPMA